MRHGSLFSGIGGFDLAAEWMGWENVFHCEWMEFPRKVLDYYWPDADSHIDICKTDFTKYANKIDILTGGFPCQPFSLAGKRKGTDDERYLWGEMLRAIQEIKPKYVIAENVFGITNIDGGLVFEQVCVDLEAEGYEVQPFIIPAASKNAPHRRDRCWFIGVRNAADTKRTRLERHNRKWEGCPVDRSDEGLFIRPKNKFVFTDTNGNGCEQCNGYDEINASQGGEYAQCNANKAPSNFKTFPTQSPICSGDDGLPTQLDGITFSKWRAESIKGYGNAIVPQVAHTLFQIIEQYERPISRKHGTQDPSQTLGTQMQGTMG
jgi:DNA (cytosine-5)-methyltransferase 1